MRSVMRLALLLLMVAVAGPTIVSVSAGSIDASPAVGLAMLVLLGFFIAGTVARLRDTLASIDRSRRARHEAARHARRRGRRTAEDAPLFGRTRRPKDRDPRLRWR